MTETKKIKNLISSAKAASILGVSRVTVFRKIKSGELKAVRIGRSLLVFADQLTDVRRLTDDRKKEIEETVRRAVDEYGETFRLLGRE